MLSIKGHTYVTVFANLADDERLDATERAAARKVADWFTEWEQTETLAVFAHHVDDHETWERVAREQVAILRRRPFLGNPSPERPQEFRSFIVGDVKFTVFPHTTGPTMNVGIDRVAR
jgi:hypothetical protein